jgi:PAS domain S-box-containing protein
MAHADLTHAVPAAQALAETAVGVTLADVRDPELPLVYVNEAFTRLTGYTSDDALGRNCRFLQGPGTERAAVQRIRDALAGMRETRVTLLNYRRDGTPFHNELLIAPHARGRDAARRDAHRHGGHAPARRARPAPGRGRRAQGPARRAHAEGDPRRRERVGMSGRFSTCACLAVQADGRVDVALAGQPAEVELRGPPLGVALDIQPSRTTLTLAPGDGLLLPTDGITEARVSPGSQERLGEEGLRGALVDGAGRDTTATLHALLQVTPDLAAGAPSDDVCLLALRRR